jgi:septum formation protein
VDGRRLVLASASPARRRQLEAAGIDADVVVSGVDESRVEAAPPEVLCLTLARLKARAVADRLGPAAAGVPAASGAAGAAAASGAAGAAAAGTLVLGCDSLLDFDGEVLGKPADAAHAVARWRRMRGRSGSLHTGHCLVDLGTGKSAEGTASTTVRFADVADAEIEAYVGTGEPLRVAGGFTIDGIGGPFVDSIDGDVGTVIGLSLPLLRRLLAELGTPVTALWRDRLTSAP